MTVACEMMLQTVGVPRIPGPSAVCLASNVSTQQLRSQLHQLHGEADSTKVKASNARLRLLRLSEAAEKIQQQAANCVRIGKEDEARGLLFQRKKILQALKKSKSRIELFDELLSKLNEAISVKETQLIGSVNLDIEPSDESASKPILIVSPKQKDPRTPRESEDDTVSLEGNDDQEPWPYPERDTDLSVRCANDEPEDLIGPGDVRVWNKNGMLHSLMGVSSFEDLLKQVDQQLGLIETELDAVLKLSTLLLESEEKPQNLKARQIMELHDGISSIRERIASIKPQKMDIR